jgi:hypothetical protein
MLRVAMSAAASGLLRAILGRARVRRDRILLIELQSTDWQSLTLTGERHEISLRIPPPDADEVARRLVEGLEDAEFAIPGQIVADIAVAGQIERGPDDSIALTIEGLTVIE